MLINKHFLLMNEADGGQDVDAGGGAAPASDSKSSIPVDEFNSLKSNYEKMGQSYNQLTEMFSGLQPQLEIVQKLQSAFSPQTGQDNPRKFDKISMVNVTEAAEEAIRSGELTAKEVSDLRNQINELKSYKETNDYMAAQSELEEIWVAGPDSVFGDRESYVNALNLVGKMRPDLEQALAQAQAQGKVPGVGFVQQVNDTLAKIVLAEMLNPESKIAQSVHAKIARKKALADNSVMDGDGYRPNKQKDDGFISVSYS